MNITSSASKRSVKPSYANVAKIRFVKPAVVIKPKSQQTSKKTIEEISSKIDKNDLKMCDTRNIRNGGVVLCCDDPSETLKVKQMVNEKLGSNYEVTLPKVKLPRVRITNIAPDISNDIIIAELKKHNEPINNMNMRLITVIPRKIRSTQSNELWKLTVIHSIN